MQFLALFVLNFKSSISINFGTSVLDFSVFTELSTYSFISAAKERTMLINELFFTACYALATQTQNHSENSCLPTLKSLCTTVWSCK